jgi:3-deoxy-7-phosphoheptulonate synthase
MSKESNLSQHQVKVGTKTLPGDFCVIAGHCTIDPKQKEMFFETAFAVKEAGADMIRGGVWKPRTSPHSFQGDARSLEILLQAREKTGLPINTEVMDFEQLKLCVEAKVDCLQVGARSALNYRLLQQIGEMTKDTRINVLLKRSMHMGPVSEFILAAEYIVAQGNPNIMLCPRGTVPTIEGFRNAPDESITLLLKDHTWAPVVVDPSHSVGKAIYVPNACLAAAAYGADGILVETHCQPKKGTGDDPKQAVTPKVLEQIIKDTRMIHTSAARYLTRAPTK